VTVSRRATLLVLALAAGAAAAAGPVRAGEAETKSLEAEFARIVRPLRATAGVCAIHLESGATAGLRMDREFILQSTFKTLVAGATLDAVDGGALALGTPVPLRARDMAPNASVLTERHPLGGVSPAVHELLDLMVTTSDNTACDALLRTLGGPARVTDWLARRGFRGIHVDRDEFALNNDWYGLRPPPESTWTAASLRALRAAVPARGRAAGAAAFLADPRDRATPLAYARVLAALHERELLSPASTDTLLAMLGRCRTGVRRLPAMLPPQARVAHKTGTGGTWAGSTNAVNDAGIVTLPGGGGHVVVVVFLEDVRSPLPAAERAIARIARAAFDHWNAPE
jgi:beta-lactamase class A